MLADRIYNDPSYGLFDAMIDMGAVTERHVHEVIAAEQGQALWAGGSLGRREMLPNSDLDLFVLSDRPGPPLDVAISGLDKVDLGQLLLEDAVTLLETTLVDANRIVDGRPLDASALGDNLRAAVRRINTPDRQLANMLAEHAYYHYFDFPQKRTPFGPNLKYSSGSARVMLFFDFVHRYVTGEVPAQRSERPGTRGRPCHDRGHTASPSAPPLDRVGSAGEVCGDLDVRCDRRSEGEACLPAGSQPGARDLLAPHDVVGTPSSRRPGHRVRRCSARDRGDRRRPDRARAAQPPKHRSVPRRGHGTDRASCVRMAARLAAETPAWRRALLTDAAWQVTKSRPCARLVRALADDLMQRPVSDSYGGLMAVACSPTADDDTLRRLVTWLARHDPGAYLAKLIRRNPAASPATRQLAAAGHSSREVLCELK